MKIKSSIDYGMRAVFYLAVKNDICSSREISEEMNVPRDYLIQLAIKLRNAGLIVARPGKNGGYVLTRPASEITLEEVLDAFDTESKQERKRMKKEGEAGDVANTVRELHDLVNASMGCFMSAISVQDLIDAKNAGESSDLVFARALEAEAKRLRESK